MTMTEAHAKLAELEVKAKSLATLYNEAYQGGDFNTAKKIDDEMEQTVNEHTSIARTICFDACKAADDPMRAAIVMQNFRTIAIKDKEVGEEKIPVREVVDRFVQIDLLKLHKYCGGIGANKDWVNIAQKVNFHMTAMVCAEIGADVKKVHDSYALSEAAKAIELGKSPCSDKNIFDTMQGLVAAMVGDDVKMVKKDLNYINRGYARKKRALTIACSNHSTFVKLMADVCHRILTDKVYDPEYKMVKK